MNRELALSAMIADAEYIFNSKGIPLHDAVVMKLDLCLSDHPDIIEDAVRLDIYRVAFTTHAPLIVLCSNEHACMLTLKFSQYIDRTCTWEQFKLDCEKLENIYSKNENHRTLVKILLGIKWS